MIDTEHSATNVRALEDLIRTAEAAGVISWLDPRTQEIFHRR
jgi:hypothetical protein